MTPLVGVVAALLAVADVPASDPAATSPTDAPPAEGRAEPPPVGAPPAAPPAPARSEEAPTPERPVVPRELNVFGGVGVLRLLGISARGGQGRIACAGHARVAGRSVALQLAGEFFLGETEPGLAMRSGKVSLEWWSDLGRVVRFGVGPDWGMVAYRRATISKWELGRSFGLHAGVEARLVRWRFGAVVLGAHAASDLGTSWLSGAASLGLRLGGGRGQDAARGTVRATGPDLRSVEAARR